MALYISLPVADVSYQAGERDEEAGADNETECVGAGGWGGLDE